MYFSQRLVFCGTLIRVIFRSAFSSCGTWCRANINELLQKSEISSRDHCLSTGILFTRKNQTLISSEYIFPLLSRPQTTLTQMEKLARLLFSGSKQELRSQHREELQTARSHNMALIKSKQHAETQALEKRLKVKSFSFCVLKPMPYLIRLKRLFRPSSSCAAFLFTIVFAGRCDNLRHWNI